MRSARCAGFTLAELLVVVAIVAVTAGIVVPSLSYGDANALSLAASEAGNALRMARSEAVRSGRAVFVDAGSAAGRLQLWYADCVAAGVAPAVLDPATRRAADVTVAGGPLTPKVTMSPNFVAPGGTVYAGLVFDAGGAAQVCDPAAMVAKGAPQAGSGLTLVQGSSSIAVVVDAPTGRVTWP